MIDNDQTSFRRLRLYQSNFNNINSEKKRKKKKNQFKIAECFSKIYYMYFQFTHFNF